MTRIHRRRLLRTIGVGAAVAVAGCGGDGSLDAETPEEETPQAEAAGADGTTDATPDRNASTETPTETPPDAPTAVAASGAAGPERAVEGYLDGVDRGDEQAATEYLHPDGELSVGEINEPGVTIHELQQVTVEEATERDEDIESAEAARERVESVAIEQNADDWVVVYSSITSEEHGEEQSALIVLEEGDRWFVWGPI